MMFWASSVSAPCRSSGQAPANFKCRSSAPGRGLQSGFAQISKNFPWKTLA